MTQTKTILITGASRGIGLLTAKELAARGHRVYAGMRDLANRNARVAEDLRQAEVAGTLIPVDLDVTDETGILRLVAEIEAQHPIDVLINNAGIMPVGVTEAFTQSQSEAVFDVNVYGIMRMCRAVLPAMRARKNGLVISLSSSAGRFGMPFFGLYCSSKWAMEAYCEALHYELDSFGIESLLIEPSGHGTDLVTTAPAPLDTQSLYGYGDLSFGRDRLLGMFKGQFEQGHAENDAGNVARCIADLIAMAAPRPIRTQIGADMGVSAVNDAVAPIQAALIDALKPVYQGAPAQPEPVDA